jgi:phosphoglycerate-specific signal transduction histidine kinase
MEWFPSNLLSNDWINWFMSNYSMAFFAVPSVITLILKLIAIYNPNIKSSEVAELFEKYWPKK